MRILIPGAGGLVGTALRARASASGHACVFLDRSECDVTDPRARSDALRRYRPDAVLFCAARTAVDACANDPSAEAVNVSAPAAWAAEVETWLLSSNFVFGGPGPHAPGASPRPAGVYADQKMRAEAAVLGAGGHVARVGWVYGPNGRTFASTLAARLRAGEAVRALYDVRVQPTWSLDLADALFTMPRGVVHHAGRGEASWYGFALAVWARVRSGTVVPVRLAELGLAEPRPRDARLAPATLPPWWDRVEALVSET
ncbi:MAG: sugar nucleotide-binding protein [Pseudomonadota bacterium]|nr:sugar nucleotide-binding protein [Pseudomonadota bacterium]